MKKKHWLILACIAVIIIVSTFIFQYYHPTHYSFNDRFVIGNTKDKIAERYGEFYSYGEKKLEDTTYGYGVYMIRDNTPEWIMSYDDSLWYEIRFKNGIAIEVNLREGYLGG